MSVKIPEPWLSFLREVDRLLDRPVEVHCLGGFVLAKLGRNSSRDRSDVEFLVQKGVIDPGLLNERFEEELRPYVLNEAREAITMSLWLDEFFGPD